MTAALYENVIEHFMHIKYNYITHKKIRASKVQKYAQKSSISIWGYYNTLCILAKKVDRSKILTLHGLHDYPNGMHSQRC